MTGKYDDEQKPLPATQTSNIQDNKKEAPDSNRGQLLNSKFYSMLSYSNPPSGADSPSSSRAL